MSFIYSEYFDSNTTGTEPEEFSKDEKNPNYGIKKIGKGDTANKKIGIKKKVGIKIFFSFLYKAG